MSKPKASNKKYPYGIQEFVAKSDFFSELHYSSIERIARRMRTKRYKRDGIVCREGDEGNSMFIIVSGEVAILKDVGWGQRELGRMGAGESFGEMALKAVRGVKIAPHSGRLVLGHALIRASH